MRCQQCDREGPLIPCRVTNLTFLDGHVLVGGRGGRDQSYLINVCGDCLINLMGTPGGDAVKVEPDMLAAVTWDMID
jgi:prepilin-type processing-associated H-X9-DG protein